MPAFEYQALNTSGRTVKGVLDGDAERQVRAALRDKGLIPLKVQVIHTESTGTGAKPTFSLRRRGISSSELSLITRQFATLIRAGLTIEECMNALIEQTESSATRAVLAAVRGRVMEGQSLARSLAAYPRTFPDIYRALIDAGEQTGRLGEVLERLAEYTENREALQQKVMLAFIYPAVVIVASVVVVSVLMVSVVPQVTRVFVNTGQTLPFATRVLIAIADAFRASGLFILLGLIGAGVGARLALKERHVRERWHRFLLTVPLVGRLVRGVNAARFASTLGILTGSGIPLLNALQYAVQVVNNLPMRGAVEEALRQVREGGSLSRALARTKLFPPMVVHLIQSGESSGKLDAMLMRAGEVQAKELENWVRALTALLEPVLILVMGLIVLFIVLAILLPIFDMNQLIK
jgi:general secretion pathway protein F